MSGSASKQASLEGGITTAPFSTSGFSRSIRSTSPAKRRLNVLQRPLRHAAVRLDRVAADVRRQDDVRERSEIAARLRPARTARARTRPARRPQYGPPPALRTSAASSTTAPRAVLMSHARGFICARRSRLMNPTVSGFAGMCRLTKSASRTASREVVRHALEVIDGRAALAHPAWCNRQHASRNRARRCARRRGRCRHTQSPRSSCPARS